MLGFLVISGVDALAAVPKSLVRRRKVAEMVEWLETRDEIWGR